MYGLSVNESMHSLCPSSAVTLWLPLFSSPFFLLPFLSLPPSPLTFPLSPAKENCPLTFTSQTSLKLSLTPYQFPECCILYLDFIYFSWKRLINSYALLKYPFSAQTQVFFLRPLPYFLNMLLPHFISHLLHLHFYILPRSSFFSWECLVTSDRRP